MKRLGLFTSIAVAALFVVACTGSRTLPDFADPAKSGNFTQLATGAGGEKEPSTFWIFAGDVPFATWRRESSLALANNGWTSSPGEDDAGSRTELLASSRDGDSCLAYFDLNGGTPSTEYIRRQAKVLAPKALESSKQFSTVLYVVAQQCP